MLKNPFRRSTQLFLYRNLTTCACIRRYCHRFLPYICAFFQSRFNDSLFSWGRRRRSCLFSLPLVLSHCVFRFASQSFGFFFFFFFPLYGTGWLDINWLTDCCSYHIYWCSMDVKRRRKLRRRKRRKEKLARSLVCVLACLLPALPPPTPSFSWFEPATTWKPHALDDSQQQQQQQQKQRSFTFALCLSICPGAHTPTDVLSSKFIWKRAIW